jgi:beta-glucosidase
MTRTAAEEQGVTPFATAAARVVAGEPALEVARELLGLLTREETLGLLDGDQSFWAAPDGYNREPYVFASAGRIGVPGLRFSDGPRGVVMGHSTAFPVPMARGATWDPDLERRVGDAIGREVSTQGGDFFAGVCINLLRHPAWGRAQETYGEDPLHLGEMGVALTEGVRRHVMACVKHFALNSMENARFTVDVRVDEGTLHEVYLPHFRRVIEAGAEGVMSAYNAVNGEWCGQNRTLLTDVLRSEWGFEGVTISDFVFGVRDAAASVRAGLDIEAPYAQLRAHDLPISLKNGELDWSDIQTTALRVLTTQLRHAANRPDEEFQNDVVASSEHVALAREVAARSMVLLQNDAVNGRPVLPFAPEHPSSVAVVGRLADLPNTGDNGSSNVTAPYVVTPLEGLRSALPDTEILTPATHSIDAAVAVAAAAEVAVVVVGYTAEDEGEFLEKDTFARPDLQVCFPPVDDNLTERMTAKGRALAGEKSGFSPFGGSSGGDRASLALSPEDEDLIRAVSAANPRTIVVIVAGSAVLMEGWRDAPAAILYSWYAGMEGGNALADVLLGRTNPSGRLPFVIPAREDDLPEFHRDATSVVYDRWYGQRLLEKRRVEPAFPLGFGLSYTTFALRAAHVETVEGDTESLRATVQVTNTGAVAGTHVIQWYGRALEGEAHHQVRNLLGFSTVALEPGETVTVPAVLSWRPLQDRVGAGNWRSPSGMVRLEASSYSGDPRSSVVDLSLD